MPELAEVEYFRKRWDAGRGGKILAVSMHPGKRVFRETDTRALKQSLEGAKLLSSETRGKQMLFRFSHSGWLGIHLGMSGNLRIGEPRETPQKHDHLVLVQNARTLVYRDARMFGRVRFHHGRKPPEWWSKLPPAVTSAEFTLAVLREKIKRHARAPIKAILLAQQHFPGVGNWMADEILWQANLHPAMPAGELDAAATRCLWQKTRSICRTALKTIGEDWSDPPPGWLIHVRWKKTGRCPRDGTLLLRETIAGRTTAWCPRCQHGHSSKNGFSSRSRSG